MQLGDPRRAYFLASRFPFGGSIEKWVHRTSVPVARHQAFQAFVDDAFRKVESYSNVQVLDFVSVFCHDGRCEFGDARTSYYYDDGHLSLPGSRKLIPLLEQALSHQSTRALN